MRFFLVSFLEILSDNTKNKQISSKLNGIFTFDFRQVRDNYLCSCGNKVKKQNRMRGIVLEEEKNASHLEYIFYVAYPFRSIELPNVGCGA